jgi:hypothetical protein
MEPKVIADYGGPFVDRGVVRDPTSQMSADKGNRVFEDVAQGTRTVTRARVLFQLATSGSTISASNVTHTSVWGSGSSEKPTVTRAGAGEYTVTWAASFDDALGETESVVFTYADGQPNVRGATNGYARILNIVSNVVTLDVYDTTDNLSDLGGTASYVEFSVR